MTETILKITKVTFLLQAIVGLVFGLFFVFGAEIFFDLYTWPNNAPVFARLLGMDFIAVAFLVVLSSRENEWAKVKNVVLFVIFWGGLTAIGFTVLQFVFALPLINWSNILIYVLFTVLYTYSYIQQQK